MADLAITEPAEKQKVLEAKIEQLLAEASQRGATAAEAGVSASSGLEISVRMGEVETVEHTRDHSLWVTCYFGRRKGSASSSDLTAPALRDAVAQACTIASHTQEDPCAGLAPAELMATDVPDLDLNHPWSLDVEAAVRLAVACEDAARTATRCSGIIGGRPLVHRRIWSRPRPSGGARRSALSRDSTAGGCPRGRCPCCFAPSLLPVCCGV
jgi:PmbA protein